MRTSSHRAPGPFTSFRHSFKGNIQALVDAFHVVFLVGVVVLGMSLIVSLALSNDELKELSGAEMRATADGGVVDGTDEN